MKMWFVLIYMFVGIVSSRGQAIPSQEIQSGVKTLRKESVEGVSVEELMATGRWMITFTHLSEESRAKLSYRELDRSQNFLLIDSGRYILQVATKGARLIGKHTPEELARISNFSYPRRSGNNGWGGYTFKGNIIDLKKKVNKKGKILFSYIMEDWGRTRVSIYIDSKTGQAHISIPSLYRATGEVEPYRPEKVKVGNIIGRY